MPAELRVLCLNGEKYFSDRGKVNMHMIQRLYESELCNI